MGVVRDVRQFFSKTVRQVTGRQVVVNHQAFWDRYRLRRTVDETRPDYAFWDKLRRGMLRGYRIGGLFCKPIVEIITAGVLSSGVRAKLADADSDYTNELIDRFLRRFRAQFVTITEDLYALGDQYIIVNVDGTLSVPPPDTVQVTYDELDYRQMVEVVVTTRLKGVKITDTYTAEQRVVRVTYDDSQRPDPPPAVYDNLFGRIPIVHWANDRSANEVHGRPIYEALLHLLSRYDDLVSKGVDGAEVMGNPVPTFEGMKDIDELFDYNETDEDEEYIDYDGNIINRVRLAFDRMMTVILGEGGTFRFVSPQVGFTKDIRDVAKLLFLLILEYTRIPEAVWGGELSSARASAEQQMLPFYQMLDKRRTLLEGSAADSELGMSARGGLHELLDLWLTARALTDPQVVVGAVTFQWADLYESAEEMRFKWVTWLKGIGAMTDETALRLANVVDDPLTELENAEAEAPSIPDEDDFDGALADAVEEAAEMLREAA